MSETRQVHNRINFRHFIKLDFIKLHRPCRMAVIVAAVASLMCAMTSRGVAASAGNGRVVSGSTPAYVGTANNLGREDGTKVIEVSLWLQLHDRSQFDALAHSLYDPASPNYRHWLKAKDLARFAPTAQEAETVRQFLAAHNLKTVKTGPQNFYVRARGTVSDVETAFQVELNNYQVGGKTIRANASDPYIEGPAAELVRAVAGLDTAEFEHPLAARPGLISSLPGNNAERGER
jgi:subtilase family serine protease